MQHTPDALQHAAEQISRALGGARVEQRLEVSSPPARGLHDTANCEHADLIVLGSSHHGPLGRVFPGSVAERLLNGAPCAVAVAPRGHATRHPQPLGRILVAFDGSPEARLALQAAHALATRSGAALQVAMVIVPSSPGVAVGEAITFAGPGMIMPLSDSEKPETLKLAAALERDENAARATLETAIAELPDGARIEHQLLVGPAAATMILERARNDTDFLVLGSRAYGTLAQRAARQRLPSDRPPRPVPRARHTTSRPTHRPSRSARDLSSTPNPSDARTMRGTVPVEQARHSGTA